MALGEHSPLPLDVNLLLNGLPSRQRQSVIGQCDRVELQCGKVLCQAGEPFEYAYFPTSGRISLVKDIIGHAPLVTESIGREGMLGAPLVLSVDRAIQSGIVQTPCVAVRMKVTTLRSSLKIYGAFYRMLRHYLYFVMSEQVQTIGCTRFHSVDRRLARGLLLAHDFDQADRLYLTHQDLANMLGVKRGAVTIAAGKLQREGIIRYRRGSIAILDRDRLEASSCRCYSARVENYARVTT